MQQKQQQKTKTKKKRVEIKLNSKVIKLIIMENIFN